jgi:hypothetical protein
MSTALAIYEAIVATAGVLWRIYEWREARRTCCAAWQEIHRQAPTHPIKAVAAQMSYSREHAHRLVNRAKAAGFLPK